MDSRRHLWTGLSPRNVVVGLIALAAVVVGTIDVGTARGLGPRLFGAYLLMVGLITVAGLLGSRRPAWLAWSAPCAGLLIAITGGAALAIEINDRLTYDYDDGRRLLFGAVAVVLGCWMTYTSRHQLPSSLPRFLDPIGRPAKTRLDNLKTSVELLGLIGLAAAATAFWYTNIYLPSTSQTTVNATVELEPPPDGSTSDVHAKIVIRNESDFRVTILASHFEVVMQQLGVYDAGRAACLVSGIARHMPLDSDSAWSTALGRGEGTVVGSGEPYPAGSWLEPGEVFTTGFVAPLPPSTGVERRVVGARIVLDVVRTDVVGTEFGWTPPETPAFESTTNVPEDDPAAPCARTETFVHAGTTTLPIIEESLFNALTRDKVEIANYWWVGPNGSVLANSDLLHEGRSLLDAGTEAQAKAEPRNRRLYGLVATEASDEMTVGP